MVHLQRMRIGSRETAYPELRIPEAFWPDDRAPQPEALRALFRGRILGRNMPRYENSHVKLSNP